MKHWVRITWFTLKTSQLRIPIGNLNCGEWIKDIFMEIRKPKESPNSHLFCKSFFFKFNFSLILLKFPLFSQKFIISFLNSWVKEFLLKKFIHLRNLSISSIPLRLPPYALMPGSLDIKITTNSLYLGNHNLTYWFESG